MSRTLAATSHSGLVPLRYLGSKARVAAPLAELIRDSDEPSLVVDLFGGVGHFASQFAGVAPVLAVDVSASATTVLKWRLASRHAIGGVADAIKGRFEEHVKVLESLYASELKAADAFRDQPTIKRWQRTESEFDCAPGIDRKRDDWSLITSYFANAYFDVRQAIAMDAIRMSLELSRAAQDLNRSQYLTGVVALLCCATHITNSPGHFAQYFDVTERNATSVAQLWSRPVWDQWLTELSRMSRAGTNRWRKRNRIRLGDSLSLELDLPHGTIIYADPPYTASQYSRFYHLLDTAVLYDYPACEYGGRYRADRFKSRFCSISTVVGAFSRLIEMALSNDAVLYLTYPANGVLSKAGSDVRNLTRTVGGSARVVREFDLVHAAPGRQQSSRPSVIEEVWQISG